MIELWQALPEDIRITVLIVLGVGGFLLAVYLVGKLLAFGRQDSLLPFGLVTGAAVVLFGAVSLYLDAQPSIPGVVEGKSEQIDVDSEGGWTHDLTVQVRYTRPDTGEERTDALAADAAIYDRVSAGDPVEVRFLHLGGLFSFARLSERSTLSMLFNAVSNPVFYIIVAFAVLIGLVWLLSKRAALKAALLPVLLVLFALALVVNFLPQWRASRPLRGEQKTLAATVLEVERLTEVGGGDETEPEPLIQPFDLVQVTFVPEEIGEPVLAADIVDADSLSLEMGGSATIHYLVNNPRTIRLDGGARTYAWKNVAWSAATTVAVLLFLILLPFALRYVRRYLSRAATGPPGGEMTGGSV